MKQGHCEYFATAMAVMLRTQGIATRVVNGFYEGEYNEAADIFVVRQKNAHSWVEVYFPGEETLGPVRPDAFRRPASDRIPVGFAAASSKYLEALRDVLDPVFRRIRQPGTAVAFHLGTPRVCEYNAEGSVRTVTDLAKIIRLVARSSRRPRLRNVVFCGRISGLLYVPRAASASSCACLAVPENSKIKSLACHYGSGSLAVGGLRSSNSTSACRPF